MPNLRISLENILPRASIVASLTAASATNAYAAANLQKNYKALVHRSTGTSVQYDLTFTNTETFNFISIPVCNYSPTVTVQVRVYTLAGDATPNYTQAAFAAGPAPAILVRGKTAAQSASAYAYGGGHAVRVYLPNCSGKLVRINIVDTNNLQAAVEASSIWIGTYWSPAINMDYGVSLTYMDETTHKTTAASDLVSTIGTRKRKLKFNISKMREVDRVQLVEMMRANGKGWPMFASFFPADALPKMERDYEGIWKLSETSEMVLEFMDTYNAQIELLEV
jgi:hypothetical protein